MELDGRKFNKGRISMMIDSGTTFTHLPTIYMNNFLDHLNNYCSKNTHLCGRIPNVHFKGDSCVELQQPDKNYATVDQLLASFPNFSLYFEGADRAYTLHPKNYFYEEYLTPREKRDGIMRLCFAVKAEGEEDKIILGAFSMIDYYFYFDRKDKNIKIFKENCYLKTRTILKRERILESVHKLVKGNRNYFWMIGMVIISGLTLMISYYKKK